MNFNLNLHLIALIFHEPCLSGGNVDDCVLETVIIECVRLCVYLLRPSHILCEILRQNVSWTLLDPTTSRVYFPEYNLEFRIDNVDRRALAGSYESVSDATHKSSRFIVHTNPSHTFNVNLTTTRLTHRKPFVRFLTCGEEEKYIYLAKMLLKDLHCGQLNYFQGLQDVCQPQKASKTVNHLFLNYKWVRNSDWNTSWFRKYTFKTSASHDVSHHR